MITDTIAKIEDRLRHSGSLTPEQRADLLSLLTTLKGEVGGLYTTRPDQAQSIAAFTDISTHEATREEKDPELVDLSLKGLERSVSGFEASHPQLVQVVNSICTTLSNLGI
jgi:hypothetical protein